VESAKAVQRHVHVAYYVMTNLKQNLPTITYLEDDHKRWVQNGLINYAQNCPVLSSGLSFRV